MPNTYLLILVVSTVTLLLPLLLIKFVIETINIFSFGPVWLGIGLTLTIPSCLFMLIALTLYSKTIRCVDIVCVLLLEMAVTPFAVIPVLVIRLILYCRLAPRQPAKFIKLSFEFVFLVFILSAYACEDSIVNYIAFASLAIVTVTTVALKEYLKFRELHYSKSRSDGRECVLSLIDKL